ncbi:trans-1,2-dihydrobenzene-1,2-diol dehydrogenase-like [Convolutriloba macropyga]|uniref:trans-1,2-dihydrobenzene-1,2-diol dehydrogenase-like n=1 Tax=Convolutriloba macropyga TaxID=536237 RepID=UPI003F524005
MSSPLRWGFCCAGKIANDFSLAMDNLPVPQHRKVAVAARDAEKAKEFSQAHKFEKSYGSYKQLAEDEDVEIVYVSSLHPQHFELAKMFLEHNKHVLCEKPLTMKLEETTELVRLAEEKRLFFMEGFWSRFFPAYQSVKKLVDQGAIGDVKQIQAHMHVASPIERMTNPDFGGSAWFDIGVYCLNLVDFLFDSEPEEVRSVSYLLSPNVDKDMAVSLKYPGERLASLSVSITCDRLKTATICGTKGYIEMLHPFYCATSFQIFKSGDQFPTRHDFNLTQFRKDDYIYPNSQGFQFEIDHVFQSLRGEAGLMTSEGFPESSVMPHRATLRMAKIADTLFNQINQSN